MHRDFANKQVKKYKAYPGFIGFFIWLPWFLVSIVSVLVLIKMMLTMQKDLYIVTLIWIVGLLTIITLVIPYGLAKTILTIDINGLKYEGLKIRNNPKKSKIIKIEALWDEVKEVDWVEDENGAIRIKTEKDEIKFRVVFHPHTNAEIMQELVARIPHLV